MHNQTQNIINTKNARNAKDQLNKAKDFLIPALETGSCPYLFTAAEEPSIEASCWSAIALMNSNPELVSKTVKFLLANQNKDGGWSTAPKIGQSDWTSAVAVLTLRLTQHFHPDLVSEKVLNGILKKAFHYLIVSRMDLMIPVMRILLMMGGKDRPRLHFGKGWPWNKGGYSWVEPTAYCLMALKIPSVVDDQLTKMAITHANEFLFEHACKGGGWNHGAYFCLGEYCPPYTLTTSEALLALIDVHENSIVKESVQYLSNLSYEVLSAWSLSWNILALDAYGHDCQRERELLQQLQNEDGSFGNNYMVTALSVLALNTANGINVFKLAGAKS